MARGHRIDDRPPRARGRPTVAMAARGTACRGAASDLHRDPADERRHRRYGGQDRSQRRTGHCPRYAGRVVYCRPRQDSGKPGAPLTAEQSPNAARETRSHRHFGLTPRKYASGEIDRSGSITKAGDGAVREVLVQAALTLLTRVHRWSALKAW